MSKSEAIAIECSNPYVDDRWTSPCCYAEITAAGCEGTYECPECSRHVECTLETFTSCKATIDTPVEDE